MLPILSDDYVKTLVEQLPPQSEVSIQKRGILRVLIVDGRDVGVTTLTDVPRDR